MYQGRFSRRTFVLLWVTYVSAITILFISFELMRGYESQTERMVLTRVAGTEQYGNNLGNGLLLFVQNEDSVYSPAQNIPPFIEKLGWIADHQLLAEYTFIKDSAEVYTSQYGLVGNLAIFVHKVFSLNLWQTYLFLKIFALIFQSAIVIYFISIIKNIFGLKSAIAVSFLYFTPWLLIFSTNFFYLIQVNLLFFIIPFLIESINKTKIDSEKIILATYFIITLLYSLMSYMFVPIWLTNTILAFLFQKHFYPSIFSREVILRRSIFLLLGLITALMLHRRRLSGFDLVEKGQSWNEYILQSKIGLVTSPIIDSRYRESIFVGVFENLENYFNMSFVTPYVQNKLDSFIPNFTVGHFMLILLFLIFYKLVHDRAYYFFITSVGIEILLVSIIGLVSWLTILRPQSADNIHINVIIFFIPFMQLLVAMAFMEKTKVKIFHSNRLSIIKVFSYLGLLGILILFSHLILVSALNSGF